MTRGGCLIWLHRYTCPSREDHQDVPDKFFLLQQASNFYATQRTGFFARRLELTEFILSSVLTSIDLHSHQCRTEIWTQQIFCALPALQVDDAWISTFHVCAADLKDHALDLESDPKFEIIDYDDQKSADQHLLKSTGSLATVIQEFSTFTQCDVSLTQYCNAD